MNINDNSRPYLLLGAGCHAKVVLSLIKVLNLELSGVCDPALVEQGQDTWRGIKVLGAGQDQLPFLPDAVWLVNGIGQKVGDTAREKVFNYFTDKGYTFPPLQHPFSFVDETVGLEAGAQIMAGALIQTDAVIGKNVIINSGARIDHDSWIEEHAHIAPGAVLCGNVHVGKGAFIASGSVLIQRVCIGARAVVAAGTSVVRNVREREVIMPASVRRSSIEGEIS